MVHVSVTRAVYDKLVQMQQSLQRELGPSQTVTVPSIVRRILYQHPALKKIWHRHYSPEFEDDGNSLVM